MTWVNIFGRPIKEILDIYRRQPDEVKDAILIGVLALSGITAAAIYLTHANVQANTSYELPLYFHMYW
jgi:hypothetical protein